MHSAFGLSGEPMASQVAVAFSNAPKEQANGTKIAETNVAKREYQKEYMEYWNSTIELTDTGRPVDALIMPVAPFAAPRPERYRYYGYSTIVNTLDYSSCVIPVTNVDEAVDVVDEHFKPESDHDRQIFDDCKWVLMLCVRKADFFAQTTRRSITARTSGYS